MSREINILANFLVDCYTLFMTEPFELSETNLTEGEITEIVTAIKASSGFTDYTVDELRQYNENHKVIGLRSSGEICGVATYEFIDEEWAEITTMIVLPKYQGKGFGKKLWQKVVDKLSSRNIFAVAFNPITKNSLALKTGFQKKRFWQLPFVVQFFFAVQRFRLHKILGFFSKKELKLGELDFFIRRRAQCK